MTKKRILVVDDNPAIHEDFYQCLKNDKTSEDPEFQELEKDLFGEAASSRFISESEALGIDYVIDDAYQGDEAIEMVDAAATGGFPYSLIFMDVRMPPGRDGIQTITKIWENHPKIEVVICTAYSDYSWDDIVKRFGPTDHLMFIKKPFDTEMVKQLALALTTKWDQTRQNEAHIKELEAQVENRTLELRSMASHLKQVKDESEASSIARNKLLSHVGQEIKNPLNGILGITDLLLDTSLDEEQADYARTIKHSSDNLLTIINEILDISKLEEGYNLIDNIRFDLKTNLQTVIQLASGKAIEKDLKIALIYSPNVPDLLIGDPLRIRQILLNLVTNGINRSETGFVSVAVAAVPPDAVQEAVMENQLLFRFSVSDSGPWLTDSEKMALSMDPPQSGTDKLEIDSLSRGLSVSKKISKILNGRLWAENGKINGATIHFDLALSMAESQIHYQPRITNSIEGTRILVLSDHDTGRKVLSLYLSHWGAASETVSSLNQAIEQISVAFELNRPFDLIIVDLKSAQSDQLSEYGLKIRNICQQTRVSPIRMICLTGYSKRGDALKMQEAGYAAYLTKPIKQSQLLKCVLLLTRHPDGGEDVSYGDIINKYQLDELIPDHYMTLVIDDNLERQRSISAMLLNLKMVCEVSSDPGISLETLRLKGYSVILIHQNVLERNGLDLMNEIQDVDDLKEIPIVVIRDRNLPDASSGISSVKMKNYIRFPLVRNEVVSVLQGLLN